MDVMKVIEVTVAIEVPDEANASDADIDLLVLAVERPLLLALEAAARGVLDAALADPLRSVATVVVEE